MPLLFSTAQLQHPRAAGRASKSQATAFAVQYTNHATTPSTMTRRYYQAPALFPAESALQNMLAEMCTHHNL
jgi:hypothetical protein